jgi:gamma-glutamyl:cysteine ligase YbdK (ATP-grasp superfamily)
MGTRIEQDAFDDADYERFRERLEQNLSTLSELLSRPGFGVGPPTIGAELELFLIDGADRPMPLNQAIRAAVADPRVAVELDRFNLELNASPTTLAGCPFRTLGAELTLLLHRVAEAVSQRGGRLAIVGVLPTLRRGDLGRAAITDAARYYALDRGLRRLRHDPFRIRIAGADPLELEADDVALEGANTSFQLHLRVNPTEFTQMFNAVQLATAPVLAVAGNSPTFLGHRLWEETRIALCKQSIDDRDGRQPRRRLARMAFGTGWLRHGPLQLFAESVRLHQPLLPVLSDSGPPDSGHRWEAPPLAELRLHQGTIWRWNRAVYDPASGGHLRIEMRALPAGPTMIDMLANAAFLLGLSLWLATEDPQWTYLLPFERAEHNFYRAAQHGLAAELTWPFPGPLRTVLAAELIPELLPAARDGLKRAGVAATEADDLLDIIAARAATGQTGAVWQRTALSVAEQQRGREAALAAMFDRYLKNAATGQPIHLWPLSNASADRRRDRPPPT